jgi:DNA polymerase V
VLDSIAAKYGQENLGLGLAGLKTNRAWTMRREMVSPRATTHWDELITVAAK